MMSGIKGKNSLPEMLVCCGRPAGAVNNARHARAESASAPLQAHVDTMRQNSWSSCSSSRVSHSQITKGRQPIASKASDF